MLLRALEALSRRRRGHGAHPVWTAVSFAVFLLRTYQKRSNRDTVVLREQLNPGETLRPGESILITHTTQPHG